MHDLGVVRLPSPISTLDVGNLFVVAHEPVELYVQFQRGLLLQAARRARAYWVGVEHPRRALENVVMDTSARTGQLELLTWREDKEREPLERIQILLQDLDYFHPPAQSLFLLEGMQSMLAPESESADLLPLLTTLESWARERLAVLVLSFAVDQTAEIQGFPLFKGVEAVAGVAFLQRSGFEVVFNTRYWFSAESGLALQRRFRLVALDENEVAVEDELAQGQQAREVAQEETRDKVLATRAALMERVAPPGWLMLNTNQAFLEESAEHVSSVFMLHYDRQTSLAELTQVVYQLRRRFGLQVRIVVREVNTQLRYSQVHVLLIAGANLVIPGVVSFAHLRGLLEGLKGQVFARPVLDNLEDLLQLAHPVGYRGVVGVANFVEAVIRTLEMHGIMAVEDALVVLPLSTGVSFSDVLEVLTLTRLGDLCTRRGNWVYLFFSACREDNVNLALDRAFQIAYADLFDGDIRYLSSATIQSQINTLAQNAGSDPVLDELDEVTALLDVASPAQSERAEQGKRRSEFSQARSRPISERSTTAVRAQLARN